MISVQLVNIHKEPVLLPCWLRIILDYYLLIKKLPLQSSRMNMIFTDLLEKRLLLLTETILMYLIQVKKAFDSYKEKAIRIGLIELTDGESITDHIDFFSVHLPYRRMGEKALAYLLRHEWRHLPRWNHVIKEVGMEEPNQPDSRGTIESILADKDFMKADEKFRRAFMQTSFYNEVFENKMASSLEASAIIGNLYTASMYMGFRSLLEFEDKKGTDLESKRVGFGSYGSGSSAMVFSGIIQPEYKEIVKRMNL